MMKYLLSVIRTMALRNIIFIFILISGLVASTKLYQNYQESQSNLPKESQIIKVEPSETIQGRRTVKPTWTKLPTWTPGGPTPTRRNTLTPAPTRTPRIDWGERLKDIRETDLAECEQKYGVPCTFED